MIVPLFMVRDDPGSSGQDNSADPVDAAENPMNVEELSICLQVFLERSRNMIRIIFTTILSGCFLATRAFGQAPVEINAPALELKEHPKEEWINSKPLKLSDLRGKVVVLHFWTFGCINCIHNQPHYKNWHKTYAEKGVTVIGVHTPETEGERNIDSLRNSVEEKGLKYPIVLDNDKKIWDAWDNRWWPCTYLIDKHGIVRYRWDGELNWKKAKGEAIMRKKIEQLLAEPGPEEKSDRRTGEQ